MNTDKFLQLDNIEKTFPLPGGKEYKAVVDVNVNIKKNENFNLPKRCGDTLGLFGRSCTKNIQKNKN